MRSLAIAVSLMVALGACKGREKAHDESTATIAPAQPQPAPSGPDAMTQTVEIGDGRSVDEGGASATETASTMPVTENPTTTVPIPATTTSQTTKKPPARTTT